MPAAGPYGLPFRPRTTPQAPDQGDAALASMMAEQGFSDREIAGAIEMLRDAGGTSPAQQNPHLPAGSPLTSPVSRSVPVGPGSTVAPSDAALRGGGGTVISPGPTTKHGQTQPFEPVEIAPPPVPQPLQQPAPSLGPILQAAANRGFAGEPTSGTFDPLPVPEQSGGFMGKGQDFWTTVLEAGLAIMDASSRPGATTLGALGAGGVTAMRSARDRELAKARAGYLARREGREERRTDIAEERLNIARQAADRPLSSLGELAADRDAGRINDAEYQRRLDSLTRANTPRAPSGYEFNAAGELEAITGGPADPSQAPGSIGAVVAPIVQKVARGEQLSAAEQQALDLYQRLDPVDRMLRQAMGGGGVAAAGAAPAGGQDEDALLQQAREALAAGESKPAVAAELRAMGIDPNRL